jgi:hypothetical protein
MQALTRTFVLIWTLGAAAALALTLSRIATDPALSPWRDATLDEIAATTDRLLARLATPEAISASLATRLAEAPRNWLALDALRQTASDRAIALPAPLLADFDRLKAEDSGLLAQTGACLACAWDAANCSLTQVFLCQAPVSLTPVGDVMGLARGLKDYAMDRPVDRLDLSLSVVGLGATLAAVPSGGGSAVVKAGAGVLKTATRMGRVSRPLREMFETALKQGILWDRFASPDWLTDPALLVRPEVFLPATRAVTALDDLYRATDLTTVLHVLPLVDSADEAIGLTQVAKATSHGFIGKVEVLGKSRLLRATLRLSRLAEGLIGSLLALAAGLSALTSSLIDSRLRRAARAARWRGRAGQS